jgi:hypothetical protein
MATKKKKEKHEPQLSVIKLSQPNKEEHDKLAHIREVEKRFKERERIPIVGGYVLTTRPEHYRSKRM